jgi:hypothetical protein
MPTHTLTNVSLRIGSQNLLNHIVKNPGITDHALTQLINWSLPTIHSLLVPLTHNNLIIVAITRTPNAPTDETTNQTYTETYHPIHNGGRPKTPPPPTNPEPDNN